VFTHAEMAYQLALVRQKDEEISALKSELARSASALKNREKEISSLNGLLGESRTASTHLKNPHLHALTSSKDEKIALLTASNERLERDVKGARAQANYLEARVLSMRGKYNQLGDKHRAEIDALKASWVAQQAEHVRVSGVLDKY
jgi:chromosome segregation ATPase